MSALTDEDTRALREAQRVEVLGIAAEDVDGSVLGWAAACRKVRRRWDGWQVRCEIGLELTERGALRRLVLVMEDGRRIDIVGVVRGDDGLPHRGPYVAHRRTYVSLKEPINEVTGLEVNRYGPDDRRLRIASWQLRWRRA